MRRLDLPAKLTGAAFVHDMVRPDMLHARVLRQPGRGARLAAFDEAAVRRAAGGELRVVRLGDFVALVSADETTVQRAAMAATLHARWENVRRIEPAQQEAAWLVGQPCDDRVHGDAPAVVDGGGVRGELFAPVYRARVDRAVLRAGGGSRRASDGVDAFAGGVPAARITGESAGAVAGDDQRAARAWAGLLRT